VLAAHAGRVRNPLTPLRRLFAVLLTALALKMMFTYGFG
jgi:hypothetical protein